MNNQLKKSDLAKWLTSNSDDCGKDTFFSTDSRSALTTEQAFKKFMKEFSKEKLVSIIYDFSAEGQQYLEANGLV